MKPFFSAVVVATSIFFATGALAQSPPAATVAPPANGAPAVPADSTAAAPLALGKRLVCQTASQGMDGQDRRDQMQLCMAQAHLDCLKQAIDKKIVGPERRDFIRSCAE
jgi:hypothetical protein